MSLRYTALFDAALVDDVSGFFCLEDREFVAATVRMLVDVDDAPACDDELLNALRVGYSKLFVLNLLSQKIGLAFKPGRLPGIRRRLQRYRWSRIPFVGVFVRRFFGIPGESLKERRIRVLENQLYLLAKATEEKKLEEIGACPWGGVHRQVLLDRLQVLEGSSSPRVLALANELLRVANRSASVKEVNSNASAD